MFTRVRAALVLACAVVLSGTVAAAPAATAGSDVARQGRCERQLEAAVAGFDDAFKRRDFKAYMSYYTEDAIQVDASGNVYDDKAEIAAFVSAVMANDYTFTATVLDTNVHGCRSASVVEDSVFAIPSRGLSLHLIDGVHWVREHGRWRVSMVQNTVVPGSS